MKLELRCCCEALKLLGWIEVPEQARHGQQVSYALLDKLSLGEELPRPLLSVVLEVAHFYEQETKLPRLAVKCCRVPLEVLRRIASFEEAEA